MNNLDRFLKAMHWRYAVKKFAAGKKVPAAELNKLLEAARLSPSSLGLQPYQIVMIENKQARALLYPAACDQRKVVDAPHLLAICSYRKFTKDFADRYVDLVVKGGFISPEAAKALRASRRDFVKKTPAADIEAWAANQAFIGLGVLLSAAASAGIDACPMGGFKPELFDKVLNLQKYNLRSRVLVTLGQRSPDDELAHSPKIRRAFKDFLVRIK